MSAVVINMSYFEKYIKDMNEMVNRIVYANKEFAMVIENLVAEWNDDIYKEARNNIFHMQEPTNKFISTLEELDNNLVSWYCELYEEYMNRYDYVRPTIDMARTVVKEDEAKHNDDNVHASVETLESYVESSRKYTETIRSEMDSFQRNNIELGNYFRTRRYQEINDRTAVEISDMLEILNSMDGLAQYVEKKIATLRKF